MDKLFWNLFCWFFSQICCFSVKCYIGNILGKLGSVDKWKGSLIGCWVNFITFAFDHPPWSWPWIFKVKYWNSCISGMGGLIDVEWKRSKWIGCWADYMTLTFDHTLYLDLGLSRSIAVPQQWEGRWKWNKRPWFKDSWPGWHEMWHKPKGNELIRCWAMICWTS